jgi:hypothetical protein
MILRIHDLNMDVCEIFLADVKRSVGASDCDEANQSECPHDG